MGSVDLSKESSKAHVSLDKAEKPKITVYDVSAVSEDDDGKIIIERNKPILFGSKEDAKEAEKIINGTCELFNRIPFSQLNSVEIDSEVYRVYKKFVDFESEYCKVLNDYVKSKFEKLISEYNPTSLSEMDMIKSIDEEEYTSIGKLRQYRQHKFETKQAWAHIEKIEYDVMYNELPSYHEKRSSEKKTAIIQSVIFFPLGIFLLTKSIPVFFNSLGDGWLVKAWAIFLAIMGTAIGWGCFTEPWTTYKENKNTDYEDLRVKDGHIFFPYESMNKNMYPPDL